MAFKAELEAHLARLPAAPFLFVGAGMSRRYLGLDDWEGLLRRFSKAAGQPYDYYAATAAGDFPRAATLIAADLHERWWKDDEFEDSRQAFAGRTTGPQSALKIEISKDLANCLDGLPKSGALKRELDRLRDATIDGVITTNFDPLLEHVFPELEVFVGQDQMLFAHPQGVGEIYKVHGSCEEPDSLVLTAEDYERFNERNPYLAAKLLTVFVEHPVLFLGYSLSDPNVTQVLRSIARVLTNDRIQELQDRLIFVEWDEGAKDSTLEPIPFVTDGYTIPMLRARVPDYIELYEILGAIERRFSARVLRQLKERVYELVRTNDPKGKLFVQDLEPDVDAEEVDVVLGVGAIEKQLAHSYRGLGRNDLVEDVLAGGTELDARRVVAEVLPAIARHVHVPIFKYLRGAGLLEDDGTLKDKASVDERVAYRVNHIQDHFRVSTGYERRAAASIKEATDFNALAKSCRPRDVLNFAGLLKPEAQDPAALKRFLQDHRDPDGDAVFYGTLWFRGVCLYDWLQHARSRAMGKRRRARPRRAATRKSKKS
jgi:hypothetical protein